MVPQETAAKLRELRLVGMAEAYRAQQEDPTLAELTFDERLGSSSTPNGPTAKAVGSNASSEKRICVSEPPPRKSTTTHPAAWTGR